MGSTANSILEFYQSPTGKMARDFLLARLNKLLPRNEKGRTLIVGYGAPFADDIAAMTGGEVFLAFSNAAHAEAGSQNEKHQACCASSGVLPFADVSFDNVVAMHALEFAPDAARAVGEVQRILVAQGRAVFILPNRAGIWQWFEYTPLGEGRSFSIVQIRRLLLAAELSPVEIGTALFAPPLDFSRSEFTRGLARGLEAAGNYLLPSFGGVVVAAAQKQRYAGIATPLLVQQSTYGNLQWAAANGTSLGTT